MKTLIEEIDKLHKLAEIDAELAVISKEIGNLTKYAEEHPDVIHSEYFKTLITTGGDRLLKLHSDWLSIHRS